MRFSVIVPVYNKAYSLERCIDSVLNQTYRDFEVIIVNDGSTDKSFSVLCDLYSDEIGSGLIKIINQENAGVSCARNNGVSAASSDYLCFLDADDEWRVFFLERMKQLIEYCPGADLYCLAHLVSCANGKKNKAPKHGLPNGFKGYVEDFFTQSAKGSVANSSKVCVKRAPFLQTGGFPPAAVAGEDLFVWMKMAINGRVAADMTFAAIVHREKDDSRGARRNSVPYPFVYLSKNKHYLETQSLNRYIFAIFYKHFLRSVLELRLKEAFLRLSAYARIYIK